MRLAARSATLRYRYHGKDYLFLLYVADGRVNVRFGFEVQEGGGEVILRW